jgi:predicted TIM-barrel fold metal-dependent hydrolase
MRLGCGRLTDWLYTYTFTSGTPIYNMNSPNPIEPIIEPDLPIVDAHHHLWYRSEAVLAALEQSDNLTTRTLLPTFRRHARYLFDDFLADLNSGHNVRATVYAEVYSMYRANGPDEMKSVGEVEFANGMAAMAASGSFGDIAMCAGIIGAVDLRLGDAARDVLLAHIQAGGGRYRGIRGQAVVHDDDPNVLGGFGGVPHVLLDAQFRAGFKHLEPLGLSYDAWQLEYQLTDLIDLARSFPQTQIIVNHLGGLFGLGRYSGRTEERFARWRENIRALSRCPNVAMKLGGAGMPTCGFQASFAPTPPSSMELANEWRPYFETCIEAFGAARCMFESNFPVDAATTSYPVIWNAFKRIAAGASQDEKGALFCGTAKRVYKLDF